MQDVRQIIVPVDFQQHTEELAEYALGLASKLEAKVVFCHVVENVVYYSDFIPTNYSMDREETFVHAQQKMSSLVQDSKNKWMQCSGQVGRGDVVESILEYSQESDLIVMGTHGARGIEKILLGSVAERIIKRAKCPVLIVKMKKK